MSGLELVLILLGLTAGLELLAEKLCIPHAVLLVLGGLVIALTPGLPRIEPDPEAVFLIFVPPLLYWASITASFRDLRRNMRSILLLGTGLVLASMAAVAGLAHALTSEFTWAAAFVLGAIVSPPDAVAAIAVMRRLGVPRQVETILEGEGLVNDAVALVAYRMAVEAGVTGSFSVSKAALRMLVAAPGGILIGLAVAGLVIAIRRGVGRRSTIENTISLLTPFAAFIPADQLGVSGVLSVVTAGLFLGRMGPKLVSAPTRLQAQSMWRMVTYLLEGLIFILIGLYLPTSFNALRGHSLRSLVWYGLATSAVLIVVRLLWVFPGAYLPRLWDRAMGRKVQFPPVAQVAFVGWAGMRGGDSLAIALSLPLLTVAGTPFPARELIIFITFSAILVTLVLQGLTFAPVIRLLKLRPDGKEEEELRKARMAAVKAGLERLEKLAVEKGEPEEIVTELREENVRRLQHWAPQGYGSTVQSKEEMDAKLRLRGEMLLAERRAIIEMRDRGEISDDVMVEVQRDLDLEDVLLESTESMD
jgi:CPA1 family monovalent cation:H+ antiporter